MKEKLINSLNNTRNASHLIRVIAGGYVAYLGGTVVYGRFNGDEVTIPLLLCAIALVLVGAAIAFLGLYAVLNGYSIEYKGKKPWAASDEDEEEKLQDAQSGEDENTDEDI